MEKGIMKKKVGKVRVLYVSIAPPENNHGCRVVAYRHLVERDPFELHVVSNTDVFDKCLSHTCLTLPYLIHRLRKSRLGPRIASWVTDYENFIWPLIPSRQLDEVINSFRPDVLLVLADNSLSKIAFRAAKRQGIPIAGLFLDWVPIMKGHFGHNWTQALLSRWFRRFYVECDLAICTSDGMREILGRHPNSHVVYPMPGRHKGPPVGLRSPRSKFRLVYVGSVENFYGRMICSLIERFRCRADLEIFVIGPNADWPKNTLRVATEAGVYLGFKPPHEAASVLASADALLVVMSFEKEYEIFMRTSFTTKFLDYVAYGKPVILWGPTYCAPCNLVKNRGGALTVNDPDPAAVVRACERIRDDPALSARLALESGELHRTIFSPDHLQGILVGEIEKLVK